MLSRTYRSLRLRTRMVLVFAVPMLALLAGGLVYSSRETIAREEQAQVEATASILSAAATDFEKIYALGDQNVAADATVRLRSFETIRRLYVLDPAGQIV